MIQTGADFEELLENIFNEKSILFDREIEIGKSRVDFVIKHGEKSAIVEVKTYRSKRIPPSQLERTLSHLKYLIEQKNDIKTGLLVVTTFIEKSIKEEFEHRLNLKIWDRVSLFALTKESPTLRSDLEKILSQLNETETHPFEQVENLDLEIKIDDIFNDNYNLGTDKKYFPSTLIGQSLITDLEKIKPGKKEAKKFEAKCEEALKYIFKEDLEIWTNQQKTDDGLHIYDLICRITSTNDVWRTLMSHFNSRYIIFEFKNYKKEITQKEVYTTEKYLFKNALRTIAIIISRKGHDKNSKTAMYGSLREHGKLILCFDLEDIKILLSRKDKGEDYNGYLAEKIDDFLIKLSR